MLAGSTNTLSRIDPTVLGAGPVEARGFNIWDDRAEAITGPLPEPRGEVWEIPFGEEDLGELRQRVLGWATRQQMAPERVEDLMLAVHEIAANSIRHGGGFGVLRLWRERALLFCEVRDAGYIENPLVALRPPDIRSSSGRGLWIANTVCDLLQIHISSRGNTVRLHKLLTANDGPDSDT